jgi:hypothetical protein
MISLAVYQRLQRSRGVRGLSTEVPARGDTLRRRHLALPSSERQSSWEAKSFCSRGANYRSRDQAGVPGPAFAYGASPHENGLPPDVFKEALRVIARGMEEPGFGMALGKEPPGRSLPDQPTLL